MENNQYSNFNNQINSNTQISITKRNRFGKLSIGHWLLFGNWCLVIGVSPLFAQETKPESLIVNGDVVEYSADSKMITATGKVEVIYKGAKLTCDKLTVNTQTKNGVAEGNPRLDDQKGVIVGKKITYDFQNKTGTIIDGEFRANPYFGKAEKLEKISDVEVVALKGYVTTCDFDHPHYRIGSKRINLFPGDKIQTKGDVFYVGDTPFFYLPQLNHSLKDNSMHVQVSPGSRKDWGPYLLSAWRYNLPNNIDGRVYLDYRAKLGVAEGFGANYTSSNFGKGDLKFYYTDEKPKDMPVGAPGDFQRFLVRWRHIWEIDQRTTFTSEFYKIGDEKRKFFDPQASFLKDYFYREFERDSQPLSYALLHHNFQNSSLDFLVQDRVNHWYDQINKLPELKYTLPGMKIGESPFYFENVSSFANLNKKATTSPATTLDQTETRLDIFNRFSLPTKVAFLQFTPFVGNRETVYNKGANEESDLVRTVFYSGADVSTKFYKTINVKTNFLGMDINGLRHIITPLIAYAYNHVPTIPAANLKQIDDIDSIAASNVVNLQLVNKLQTKRKNESVDLAELRVDTSYILFPKTGDKLGSNFSDFIFHLKLLPYSWLRVESDATYKHSGNRSDANYNRFSNGNYDIYFDLAKERSIGIGQRYERKGSNQITYSFDWRLNPKWKFSIYERYNMDRDPNIDNGLLEQQYTISRDLHCWNIDFTYNSKRSEGATFFVVFKLKAFPENEFGFNQSYHPSKSGSQ